MIPQWLATGLLVSGALVAWNAWKGRDLPDMPEGVEPGTPPKAWPDEFRKQQMAYQFGRHWQAYLIGGVVLATLGIVGVAADAVSEIREAVDPEPSRDELIEAIAADSSNTYDREEAACLVDFVEATGLDPADDPSVAVMGRAAGRMSEDELAAIDECFDEETRAASRGRTLEELSDDELREFVVEFLRSSPGARISRDEAECWVDEVIGAGLFLELLGASQNGGAVSAELEAAMVAADRLCLP